MRALLLIGHGSLRQASGAAMIRLAALARNQGIAPLATAGFLNFSRPTFKEALRCCLDKGASEVVVQPYFLIDGYYVRQSLPRLVEEGKKAYPEVHFHVAKPFGYHPSLCELVLKRVKAAGDKRSALLLMAHGSPYPEANGAIDAVAEDIRIRGLFAEVKVSYMELNEPKIGKAIDALAARGFKKIVTLPYFLQLGGHVAQDLPEEIARARARHPQAEIILGDYLSYDPLLISVIAERVEEVLNTG